MRLRINTNDLLTITRDGKVGIGTNNPVTSLHVEGRICSGKSGSLAGAMTFFPPDSTAWFHIDAGEKHPISNLRRLRISTGGKPGGITMMNIWQSGNVWIKGDLHEESDIRLKKNVKQLSKVLEKIVKIRGVSFDWNDKNKESERMDGRKIGVIAQEVEKVFPELVTNMDEDDYKSVNYGKLSAVLIEALKELKADLDNIKLQMGI